MKKYISFITAICIIISLTGLTHAYKIQAAEINASKITQELDDKIENSNKSELISIIVELKNDINQNDIFEYACNKTGISTEDIAAYEKNVIPSSGNTRAYSSEKEKTSILQELKYSFDEAKTEYISIYNKGKSEKLIKENELTVDNDTFVSSLSSFIFNIKATKQQIKNYLRMKMLYQLNCIPRYMQKILDMFILTATTELKTKLYGEEPQSAKDIPVREYVSEWLKVPTLQKVIFRIM